VSFFRQHHGRIVSLHLKDRDRDPAHTDRPFGQGATPVREILELARELRFRYPANIEYELDEKDPTEGVRQAFGYVRRVLTNR
jgi:sugar phosphate isomerase/epimerase